MVGSEEKSRIFFEWRRKIFHILLGLCFALLFYYRIMHFWIAAALVILGLLISWIYRFIKIPVIDWFLKIFERPSHIKEFPGRGVISIFFSVMILTLFPKDIALASILVWTFGDAVAALFGMHYGSHRYKQKTWEGFIAGIFSATIPAAFFVPWYAAFLGSLAAMTLEFIELKVWHMDDNIFVPLASAMMMFLLLAL